MLNVSLVNLVLGGLILMRVIQRQLAPRVLRFKLEVYAVLVIVGGASVVQAAQRGQLDLRQPAAGMVIIGSLVSAIVFGLMRGQTYRIWLADDQTVWRQGNWATLLLWVVGIAVHFIIDLGWSGSGSLLLLYLGLTLLAQRGWLWWRASRRFPMARQQSR